MTIRKRTKVDEFEDAKGVVRSRTSKKDCYTTNVAILRQLQDGELPILDLFDKCCSLVTLT
jgi:hypothetical protein